MIADDFSGVPDSEEQLTQLSSLIKRIEKLEENFLLVSDVHLYGKLQHSLQEQDWFEADLETVAIITELSGKNQETLKPEDIQKFPLNALKVIDQLWRKYSNDHFGFSIQLQIYQRLGGTKNTTIIKDQKLIEQWGEKLSWRHNNQWRKCDELDYSLSAPLGCHPSQWWNSPYGSKMTNYFLARLMDCHFDD